MIMVVNVRKTNIGNMYCIYDSEAERIGWFKEETVINVMASGAKIENLRLNGRGLEPVNTNAVERVRGSKITAVVLYRIQKEERKAVGYEVALCNSELMEVKRLRISVDNCNKLNHNGIKIVNAYLFKTQDSEKYVLAHYDWATIPVKRIYNAPIKKTTVENKSIADEIKRIYGMINSKEAIDLRGVVRTALKKSVKLKNKQVIDCGAACYFKGTNKEVEGFFGNNFDMIMFIELIAEKASKVPNIKCKTENESDVEWFNEVINSLVDFKIGVLNSEWISLSAEERSNIANGDNKSAEANYIRYCNLPVIAESRKVVDKEEKYKNFRTILRAGKTMQGAVVELAKKELAEFKANGTVGIREKGKAHKVTMNALIKSVGKDNWELMNEVFGVDYENTEPSAIINAIAMVK